MPSVIHPQIGCVTNASIRSEALVPVVPAFNTAADAFQAYLERGQEAGRVVGEMPAKVLLEAQPSAQGSGYEVLYLRQIMERAVVSDLYEFGVDERGRPVPVRMVPVKSTDGAM